MSSVPVQFLINVMDQPTCGLPPTIFPLTRCLEGQVNVPISFNLSAMTQCDPAVSDINTITFASAPTGVNVTDTSVSSNASVSYATFVWTPQASQVGRQQICFIVYTE